MRASILVHAECTLEVENILEEMKTTQITAIPCMMMWPVKDL